MFKLQFEKDIQEIRHRIANKALIFGSLLGILAYSGSILTISETGLKIGHFTDPATLLLFLIVWFYRERVSLVAKVWVVVFGILVLVLTNVYKSGIYSDNIVLLTLIPLFSLMALPLRRTIMVYIIAVALMLVLLFVQKQGLIEVGNKNFVFRLHSVEVWMINTLLITIVAFTFVIVNQQFNRKFSDLIAQLEANNIALAEKEQNYREIFNASADAIFIHNLDGSIVDVNEAMLKLYGYSEKCISEFSVEKLSAHDFNFQTDSIQKKFEMVLEQGTQVFDWHARSLSGREFWVEVTLKKVTIAGHDRVLAFVRDVDEKRILALQLEEYRNNLEQIIAQRTHELQNLNEDLRTTNEAMNHQHEELQLTLHQLRETQMQLVEKEKMASVGVLASGVAHEINNPLNYIKASAYALRNYIEEHKESEGELGILLCAINQGVDRAAAIVLNLNQLNRNSKVEKTSCDVHQILGNCLVPLESDTKNRIKIVRHFAANIPMVQANEGKLFQAFMNVMKNAVQAIPHDGMIEISTNVIGTFIEISIKDNGEGIKNEHLTHVAEPFFTTREPGKGTGLGLSITYKILEEISGKIEFISEIGSGTTVIIKLPVANE